MISKGKRNEAYHADLRGGLVALSDARLLCRRLRSVGLQDLGEGLAVRS